MHICVHIEQSASVNSRGQVWILKKKKWPKPLHRAQAGPGPSRPCLCSRCASVPAGCPGSPGLSGWEERIRVLHPRPLTHGAPGTSPQPLSLFFLLDTGQWNRHAWQPSHQENVPRERLWDFPYKDKDLMGLGLGGLLGISRAGLQVQAVGNWTSGEKGSHSAHPPLRSTQQSTLVTDTWQHRARFPLTMAQLYNS